jgi:PAS domain S-box-containing protein
MSTAVELTMKVLYVKGPNPTADESTLQQLRTVAPEMGVTLVANPAEALAEVRRTTGWHALLLSPALPQNETLALIASLRRDRAPIAIVPVVDEAHQDLFAAAVASGADDVLMRRGQTLVNVTETLTRIRQSPHLFPAEHRRRIAVIYAGRDPLVWNLLDQVPFVKAEKINIGIDGSCPVRLPGAADGGLRCDAVVIDEQPGEAHPLQVLKSVKAQASDLPVIVLTSSGAGDIGTAALELGADDTVMKTGIFRRRLIATLRRVHQRLELTSQQLETKAREERLRQIVENVPTGITVIGADGVVLAMNGAALRLFGAARPRDIVGRDVRHLVAPEHHGAITELIRRVTKGEATATEFTARTLAGTHAPVRLQGVVLERDAKGGRGVVASVSSATGDLPLGGVSTTGELAELRDTLQRMERHYAELEDARGQERTAWEDERHRLETRLEAAERLASERETLAGRLDEVTAELARANDAFAAEKTALEQQVHDLESTTREAALADDARSELQGTLETVREELRQAIAAHALERGGWQTIREDLEGRLGDLDEARSAQADQVAGLAALQQDVQDLRAALASERESWAAQKAQLESDLRQAREALWAEEREREQARERTAAELNAIRQTLIDERETWASTHATLTTAHQDAQASRETVEAELARRSTADADARAEAQRAFEEERQAWQAARARLEEEARQARSQLEATDRDARAAGDAERQQWEADRSRLEDDLRAAIEDAAAVRADAEAAREAREAELRAAHDLASARQQDIEALGRQIETRQQEAQRSLEGEREGWTARQAQLEGDLNAARAAHDAGRQIWDSLRAGLEDELHRTRDLVSSSQGDWDAVRAGLEHAAEEAREAAGRTAREADAAREQHDRDLQAARDAHASERQEWTDTRAQHDTERRQILERADAAERELADARASLDAERHQAEHALTHERQAWDEARRRIEAELHQAREDAESIQRELEATQAQLETDRRDARAAAERERHSADATRAALEQQIHDVQAAADEQRQALDQHVADLTAARRDAERRADEHDRLEAALDAARAEIRHTDESHAAERVAWEAARVALETRRAEADALLASSRQAWDEHRAVLEADARAAADLRQQRERLEDALNALRSDYATMVQSLAGERAVRDQAERDITALRETIAAAEARHADMQQQIEQVRRDAADRLQHRDADHAARVRALEEELIHGAQRLARVTDDADRTRASLQAEYLRASESHHRLISSDLFGYAVTTFQGELVRCNDTFARLFGFGDAPDALTRTAGRLFPGLSDRSALMARLTAEGHADQIESCLERIDGQAIRILESVTLLTDGTDQADEETLVEHVMIGALATPDSAQVLARRLEEVGALCSAMVPEIERIVAAVHERGRDVRRALRDREVDQTDMDALVASTAQVNALVRQLGAFSRRQVRESESVDLSEAVTRTEPVLVRLVGDYIGFAARLSPTPPITVHRDDLDQLLTSMVTFGRDLLAAGGSLSIEVRPMTTDQHDASGQALAPASGTLLAVTASGYGVQLPPDAPAVALVARRCGGTVRLSGDPGWMARIEVEFPRCSQAPSPGWNWLIDRR